MLARSDRSTSSRPPEQTTHHIASPSITSPHDSYSGQGLISLAGSAVNSFLFASWWSNPPTRALAEARALPTPEARRDVSHVNPSTSRKTRNGCRDVLDMEAILALVEHSPTLGLPSVRGGLV